MSALHSLGTGSAAISLIAGIAGTILVLASLALKQGRKLLARIRMVATVPRVTDATVRQIIEHGVLSAPLIWPSPTPSRRADRSEPWSA